MQGLTRRSLPICSSTEQSDTRILESHEEIVPDEEFRPRKVASPCSRPTAHLLTIKKRATAETVQSINNTQSKRARRFSSKNKDADSIGDFIVVAPSSTSRDFWSSRTLQPGRDGLSNSPMLSPSSLSSLESICSPISGYSTIRRASDGLDSTTLLNSSKPVSTFDGCERQIQGVHATKSLSSELVHADCETSIEVLHELCSESSVQDLLAIDNGPDAYPTSNDVHVALTKIALMKSEPLAAFEDRNTPQQTQTMAAWVSVNAPSMHKPSSFATSESYQGHLTPSEHSPTLQESSLAPKRTPLPTDKVESKLSATNVLPNIPQDPMCSPAEPQTRFHRSEETNSVVAAVRVTEPVIDYLSVATITSPPCAAALPLQIVDPSGSLDGSRRQLGASGSLPASANSEALITMARSSVSTTKRSISVENGTSPVSSQDLQPFNTFPSKFQVSTTDSFEQHQSNGQKRRYRKKNTREQVRLGNSSSNEPYSEATEDQKQLQAELTHDGRSSVGPKSFTKEKVLQQSYLQVQEQAQPPSSGIPFTTIDKLVRRSPITQAKEHQLLQPSRKYSPPAVEFTIDNRAESVLAGSEVNSLFADLSKYASVLLVPSTLHSSNSYPSQPIGILMWQTLSGFYSWYSILTGVNVTWRLKFELIDVHWQSQKSFILPHDNIEYFRALKQYVWDLYWIATSVNERLSPFRVSIAAHPIDGEHTRLSITQKPESESESLREVSPHQHRNQTLLDIQPLQQLRSEARLHTETDVQTNISSAPDHELFPPESRLGTTLPTKHSNSNLMIRPTAASSKRKSPSTRPNPLKSDTNYLSWHSHRMPHKSSSDDTATANSGVSRRQSPRPAHEHSTDYMRTESDKTALRTNASQLIPKDMELFPEESSVYDKFPYKTGAQVLGAIIDKMGGIGTVSITGKGYITQNITTGLEEVEDRYQRVNINAKQTCMLHKGAIVLYYKRRSDTQLIQRPSIVDHAIPPSRHIIFPGDVLSPSTEAPREVSASTGSSPQPNISQAGSSKRNTGSAPISGLHGEIDISIRVQIERSGAFSAPIDKSFLRPSISVTEFFSWFSSKTGCEVLTQLKFTFKDAMPAPTSTQILSGNEDHFSLMRKDIKVQCAKAKTYMPDLKEFVILITVPGWDMPTEEDW